MQSERQAYLRTQQVEVEKKKRLILQSKRAENG